MLNRIIKLFESAKQEGKSSRSIILQIGLSETDLQEWKSGRSKPTIEKIIKIADYFNVSLDYLVGRDETKKSPAEAGDFEEAQLLNRLYEKEAKIIKQFNKLNSEQKDLIAKIIDDFIQYFVKEHK